MAEIDESSIRSSVTSRTDRVELVEVDLPSAVERKCVGDGHDTFEGREKIEKRVARPWHEDTLARIAQELEEKSVSLARAGGEHERVAREAPGRARPPRARFRLLGPLSTLPSASAST